MVNKTLEIYICEVAHLCLHVNQSYIFRVHPTCEECNRLAQYTPTINVEVDIVKD
jgi:hypothetical protein